MPDVVGVRFKPVTKIYYFLPATSDVDIQVNDPVIVETSRGKELGWVALASQQVPAKEVKGKLKPIIRKATPLDLMKMKEFQQKEAAALEKCKQKVLDLDLPMKVVAAEYSYDGSRLLFAFSAEQRVDFRDLVRALVRSLRTRVEMRQIGARDEAKIIDGYGRCGRQLCCSSWLTEFHPVSIRMAKNQQLPLAPTEISGVCGRLLCCLAYEDSMYTEIRKTLPKVGSKIQTGNGQGVVKGVNILKRTLIVDLGQDASRTEISIDDINQPGDENASGKQRQSDSNQTDRPSQRPRQSGDQPDRQSGNNQSQSEVSDQGQNKQQPRKQRKSRKRRSGKKSKGQGQKDSDKPPKSKSQDSTSQQQQQNRPKRRKRRQSKRKKPT